MPHEEGICYLFTYQALPPSPDVFRNNWIFVVLSFYRYLPQVLLITTCGEIDIELWSKEAHKACRNFIQLCLEGYYDGTIFHRIVKGSYYKLL